MATDLNSLMYLNYLDAGATSVNLAEAEQQALIAAGALDGKWNTFLVQQGYAGNQDGMYKYLGDKGYTAGSLNERMYQAAAALDLLAAAYPLSFSELGISGLNGFVIDGSQADCFYQDSGMTTPCTSAGDPVGAVVDLSGNGNHFIQTVTANKPVYYTTNGLSGFTAGTVTGQNRWLENTGSWPEKFTYVCVRGTPYDAPSAVGVMMGNANDFFMATNYNGSFWYLGGNDSAFGNSGWLNPKMAFVYRTGSGANQIIGTEYKMYGDHNFASGAGTDGHTKASGTLYHGGDNNTRYSHRTMFEFYAEGEIGADARTTILNYVQATFNDQIGSG
jgi:hypothetical protein